MLIYIVDHDVESRLNLANLARDVGHDIVAHSDMDSFFASTASDAFGCVFLDMQMPGRDGLPFLTVLAARAPAWPVVMISSSADVDDAIAAFRHGVLHFLRKPYHRAELVRVLGEAVAVGEARLAEYRRATAAPTIRLSQREREVLGALAEGRQSKVIAWQLGVSVRTIDMHRSNILTKLRARNASQAVAIARDLNLLDLG